MLWGLTVATVTEKIPYYRVKKGVGYWEPPAWARKKPYEMVGVCCGPDGHDARTMARERVEQMRRMRSTGEIACIAPEWPSGSLGHFYEKWIRTPGFANRAVGTREEYHQAWHHVPDNMKRKKISAIRTTDIEHLHIKLQETAGEWTRWRTIKKLRNIFGGAVSHGILKLSPATTMSNPEPEGRGQMWQAAEIEKMIDKADELGKPDMALAIALAWATLVSPIDIRTLTRAMIFQDTKGVYIHRARSKTAVEVYVDLDDKTARRLRAYVIGTPTTLPDVPIIRGERDGKAFRNRHEFARRFATIRRATFGKQEKRQLRDIRRSGNVEADLGGADKDSRALILGNALNVDPKLERTYTPPTLAKARELRKQREAGRDILAAVDMKGAKGT